MLTISSFLRKNCAKFPDRKIFSFLNGKGDIVDSYSYQQFEERTNFVASILRQTRKIMPGDRVLLIYSPGIEFIISFIACAKIGAVSIPFPPFNKLGGNSILERLYKVVKNSSANIILSDTYQKHAFSNTAQSNVLEWIDTTKIQGCLGDFELTEQALLFLQYTSGSTRDPKGVMVSHENVIENSKMLKNEQDVGVFWLPHYHDMGLIGYYLFPLIFGKSSYHFSALDFLARPLLWLETITRFKAARTSAPNFAFEYCLQEDKIPLDKLKNIDLSSLFDMMNAAEPVRAGTRERFLKKFSPCGLKSEALTAAYGLAEHTLAVSTMGTTQLVVNKRSLAAGKVQVVSEKKPPLEQMSLMSCGIPLEGTDVQIVDPETCAIKAEGYVGEIWVNSPSKAGGYWGEPALSEDVFCARLVNNNKEYLRTRDMGFLYQGELYVTGRLNDMIIIRGENIFPADIEAIVETNFPTIKFGKVVSFGSSNEMTQETGVIILIETKNLAQAPDPGQVFRVVMEACQISIHIVAIVQHGTIVKTSSGKIARQKCKEKWLTKEVVVLSDFCPAKTDISTVSVEDYLEELLLKHNVADDETITMGQLGLDSLDLVSFVARIDCFIKKESGLDSTQLPQLHDLRLVQSLSIKKLKDFFREVKKGNVDEALVTQFYTASLASLVKNEFEAMRKDAILSHDIVPKYTSSHSAEELVLLTGITGFLGCFLAEALLRLTHKRIVTLVRAQDIACAKKRVLNALKKTGLSPACVETLLEERIELICGDISQPKLGLSTLQWEDLVGRVTCLYHCAAEVDYIKPYHHLRTTNVLGTQEILRLACSGVTKELHYISTTFVFGWNALDKLKEIPASDVLNGLDFGYSQSKWVAEKLIIQAQNRGLKANIFRPALITASSNGEYIRGDISTRFIGYMIRNNVTTNMPNQLSFLPVHVCANNIVAVSCLKNENKNIFHVTLSQHHTIENLTKIISKLYGYRFQCLDLDEIINHINIYCKKDDDLYPLVPFFTLHKENFKAMSHKRYDNQNYKEACMLSPFAIKEPLFEDTVHWIISFLIKEGLVPTVKYNMENDYAT